MSDESVPVSPQPAKAILDEDIVLVLDAIRRITFSLVLIDVAFKRKHTHLSNNVQRLLKVVRVLETKVLSKTQGYGVQKSPHVKSLRRKVSDNGQL